MALTVDDAINPIKVTGTATGAEVIFANLQKIAKIVWFGATTDAHLLIVEDSNAKVVWKSKMTTLRINENLETEFRFKNGEGLMVNGLSISDMDSGEVYIYLDK